MCTPCSNASHVVFICLPGMDQLQQNCGLDGELGPCSACGCPLWAEDVVWLWTHGFWRLRNCASIKDGHGHVTLQRSRLHVGPSQSSSDGCLLLHCLVPYGCNGLPKCWLLVCIICSGAALGVNTVPLLMVLRRLERNWEDGSMGKSPCRAT